MATMTSKRFHNPKRGFTLLVAVIFMSVMLALGLALASLGYKQTVLASSATESQNAFYAADTALECALYADQHDNAFAYANGHLGVQVTTSCDNMPVHFNTTTYVSIGATARWVTSARVHLDDDTPTPRCADVTIYKYKSPQGVDETTTFLFSQGYDTSCDTVEAGSSGGARFVVRGLSAHD